MKKILCFLSLLGVLGFLANTGWTFPVPETNQTKGYVPAAPIKADQASTLKAYGKLPLYFIENKGQLDPKVRFYVKTSGQTLYFTDEGIVFDLLRGEKEAGKGAEGAEKGLQTTEVKTERLVFNLGFENPQQGVLIEGLDRQDAGINYFVGNDRSKWKTGISTYKGVIYQGIYKGIDLKVFGNGKDIEYEFIVNPGGDPDDILLTYNGIEGLATNGEGDLLIGTAFGELMETKPYIYQEIEGKRTVDGNFEIRRPASPSQPRKLSYGFQVAAYDLSYPLIIDPTLSYSTYLGGSDLDAGYGIAVDGSGNAYVTGRTWSSDFPTQDPYQGTYGGGTCDAFITKLSSSGSVLSYSTYLGGSSFDIGYGIAVDGTGNAYVTGETKSYDFPMQNPYQGTYGGGTYDAFITKLSSSGSVLSYSTYLGGSSHDNGYGIAVDGTGNAYVTGETSSSNFPTQNPYQGTCAGGHGAFITKLSSSGSVLSYSTYLGGSSFDWGYGIAVDGTGNAYVTGSTWSSDFPTQDPYQGTYGGGNRDAFITKLSSSGSALSYSTYLGGNGDEYGRGIAVDGSGNAYVTGETSSSNFPTQDPYQGTCGGGTYDAFITKLSSSGSVLSYSTYLGGNGWDFGKAIAVDGSGNADVTGFTASPDFPTQNPYQGTHGGGSFDAFITKLSSLGSTLMYSTYLGGNGNEHGSGIAVDGSGNAYVAGHTASPDFPTQDPYQGTHGGGTYDAFVTKLLSDTTSPTVTTTAASSITQNSASSGGNVTSDGGVSVIARGVCWNTSANPTVSNTHTSDGTGTGSFTSSITGLSPATTYHVRAYSTNSEGIGYGDDMTFTTTAPILVTFNFSGTVTEVTDSAIFGGVVIGDKISGSYTFDSTTPPTGTLAYIYEFPNEPSTQLNVQVGTLLLTQPFKIKVLDDAVVGLVQDLYGVDSGDEVSSEDIHINMEVEGHAPDYITSLDLPITPPLVTGPQIMTANINLNLEDGVSSEYLGATWEILDVRPAVTTAGVSSISSVSATSGGNVVDGGGSAGVTARGVCWSTSANPTTANNKTTDGSGTGSFVSSITGLSPNTTYYVRAYATNSEGTGYGDEVSFTTTTAATTPTVITTAASSITHNSSVSGGNVTSEGGSTVTVRGVCWSTSANPIISDNHTSDGADTGSFTSSITGLSPGATYYVRAYATNSAGTGYGNEIEFTTLILPTISGTVYQSDGTTAVTGDRVHVSLYTGDPCSSPTYIKSATTNASDGTYSLTGFPAGTYYLLTSHNGTIYLNEWWASPSSSLDCGDAQAITVNVGQTVNGKDFQLNSGAIISGTVYQSDGTTPVTGDRVHVNLYSGNPCGSPTYIKAATTNASDGTYSLTGFPAGNYYLRTSHNETIYLNEWWASPSSSLDCSDAQAITVNVGQKVNGKDFQLNSGAIISGTVYQSDGTTPVTGDRVHVSLYTGNPCSSPTYIKSATTNASDGTYSLTGFPAGTYYLRTANNGTAYFDEWWASGSSSVNCVEAQSTFVTAGETATGKNFQLDALVDVVYFEDFSTEPVFTFHEGVGDHRFQWNEPVGIYEIEHIYDESDIHRYAITPQFQRVENQSFAVQVSLSTKYMTWGQHMAICFGEEDALVPGGPDKLWQISSNWDSSYSFNDGLGNLYVTPAADKNKWYSFKFDFDFSTKTVDLLVSEKETGTIFYQKNDVPFDPRPFNTVFLGNHLHHSEGSGGELHYDNILIRAISDCPSCSGDKVVIENTTFNSGNKCWCVGTVSITIKSGVTIKKDAIVTVLAPVVKLQDTVHAEENTKLIIKQQ